MDLAFDGMHGHTRSKSRTQSVFKFFMCSDDFTTSKILFIAVNASFRWLINVSRVYFVKVSLLLFGQQGSGHSSDICFLSAGGTCKFYANVGGKRPI
jgi:hypothetical protein